MKTIRYKMETETLFICSATATTHATHTMIEQRLLLLFYPQNFERIAQATHAHAST